jgi:hypothetical protein
LEELGGIWNAAERGAENQIQIHCGPENWFETEHRLQQGMSHMIEA